MAITSLPGPFLVRFQSGWFKFNLCTVHLYYGDASGEGYERRVAEIDAIAKFLRSAPMRIDRIMSCSAI
jgi:hypothetical protein